jgi:hypothetical protein
MSDVEGKKKKPLKTTKQSINAMSDVEKKEITTKQSINAMSDVEEKKK